MRRIIIYHSYTGNTKIIAEMIKDKLDCDILELKPKVPFSSNYQEVVDEYHNNSIKDKTIELEEYNLNLDDYDEIILGTPVWWYTMTPVIATFLKENNLKGKVIYPFATNAGWLGHTFKDVKKLASESRMAEELNIEFSEDYREHCILTNNKDIENWINKII